MQVTSRRIALALGVALLAAGLAWFAMPAPVQVDLATVSRGPMEVTVDDEGKTRLRHIFRVSAPVAGRLLRISNPETSTVSALHVGDLVVADETVVAVMQPTIPSFIDARSRDELQAMLAGAEAAISLATAEVRRIEAALSFSRADLARAEVLARTDTIAARTLDRARLDVATNEAALVSARAQVDVRRSERNAIAARLLEPGAAQTARGTNCCVQIRAPVTGRILRILQDSETVVPAGAPLLEIGDPADLEVVADLLSSDAVQVRAGASVRIDGWGGEPLHGTVVRVDPAGFAKMSALGIEEQRVPVTIRLNDPPERWSALGHDFRVVVHIVVWNADNVLKLPVGALFRQGDAWAAYALRDGKLRVVSLKVGRRSSRDAEVQSGLSEGDHIVVHPGDRTKEGLRAAPRAAH